MKKKTLIILTILNIILFALSICGYVGTKNNLRQFNSIDDIFDYAEEEEGRVRLSLNEGKTVMIVFQKTNAEVVCAHQFNERCEVIKIICFIRRYCALKGYCIKRSNSDLWGEYKLHTILYNVGYKREKTENANIDFVEDSRWYVNVVGKVIGWMGL